MRATEIMMFAGVMLAMATGVASAADVGRYAWSQTPEGLARLDTATGAVALCRTVDGALECADSDGVAAPAGTGDETAAAGDLQRRLDRLESRNLELEAHVARLEAQVNAAPGAGLKLPSQEEVDKMMGLLEGTLKRFRDIMKGLDDPDDGRGVPL